MRIQRIFLLSAFFALSNWCQSTPHANTYTTIFTNNIRLEMSIISRDLPFYDKKSRIDDIIYFMFYSEAEKPFKVYFLKDEYLCKVELFDSTGNLVEKSRLGNKIGVKYDSIGPLRPELLGNSSGHTSSTVTYMGSGRMHFPCCKDLFKIKKIGKYILTFELHTFIERVENNKPIRTLIKFPKIEATLYNEPLEW